MHIVFVSIWYILQIEHWDKLVVAGRYKYLVGLIICGEISLGKNMKMILVIKLLKISFYSLNKNVIHKP